MRRLEPGTRVKMRGSNQTGTVSVEFSNECAGWQTPVVWDGETCFKGTVTEDLEVIGKENPVVDEGCGIGQEAECCIFIFNGKCARHTDDRYTCIMGGTKVAQRHPSEPYPKCKLKKA